MIGGWGGEGRWDTLDHKVHKEEEKYPLPSRKWIWMVPKDGLIKGVIFYFYEKNLAQIFLAILVLGETPIHVNVECEW